MTKEMFLYGWSYTPIEIPVAWRCLDVGSGHNPHPRADVIIDSEEAPEHRRGRDVAKDQRYQRGDVQNMPFQDGEFDFISALHIAEHVESPERFARELMRVGRCGYIETPSPIGEFLLAQPVHVHPWIVCADGDTLVWYEKPPEWRMFSQAFFDVYYRSPLTAQLMQDFVAARNTTYTRFLWRRAFKWEVRKYDRDAVMRHAVRRILIGPEMPTGELATVGEIVTQGDNVEKGRGEP